VSLAFITEENKIGL